MTTSSTISTTSSTSTSSSSSSSTTTSTTSSSTTTTESPWTHLKGLEITVPSQCFPLGMLFKEAVRTTPTPLELEVQGVSLEGTFVSHGNNMITSSRNGEIVPDFGTTHIYERIWLTPSSIDAGLIVTDVDYVISFWNAYINKSVVIEAIDQVDAEPPCVFDEGVIPITISSMEEILYTLTIQRIGKIDLDGYYRFTYSVGGDPSIYADLPVTGIMTIYMQYAHNWEKEYVIEYSFDTIIAKSVTLVEQRRQLYDSARLSMQVSSWTDEYSYYEYPLRFSLDKPLITAIYSEGMTLNMIGSIIGVTSIVVNEVIDYYWNLQNKATWLGFENKATGKAEIHAIDTIVGQVLSFVTSFAADWDAAQVRVYPLILSYIDNITTTHETDEIANISLKYNEYNGLS